MSGPDPLGATSDLQLDAWMKLQLNKPGCPTWGGVFSNDELTHPKPNTIYILNLQDHNQSGTHWVLLSGSFYADPYGVVPTKHIAKFVKTYNHEDYQGFNQESCGYFCLYFAWHLMNGLRFSGELEPEHFQKNENTLRRFFS